MLNSQLIKKQDIIPDQATVDNFPKNINNLFKIIPALIKLNRDDQIGNCMEFEFKISEFKNGENMKTPQVMGL